MLIQLSIKNIALIEIIEIKFEKGLNILTGDSGSGKSLILDSLNVLFGGTNIPLNHLIRPGENDCLIEAKFSSSSQVDKWLTIHGFNQKILELTVKRISYKKNNKILTKYTLNNSSISKKLVQELGALLLDFAGQSDCLLFDSQESLKSIIDNLGPKSLQINNLEIKNIWKKCEDSKRILKEKIISSKIKDENNFAIKEMFNILEQANLDSSEEIAELELEENRIANYLQIQNNINESLKNLNNFNHEEQSVASLISLSIKNIKRIVQYDEKIHGFLDKFLNIQNDIEDLIFDLNQYISRVESCDTNLDDIQKRLFYLKNLERTFSLDLPQLIQKRDELKNYFADNSYKQEIKSLELKIQNLQDILDSLFNLQSVERKKIALKLQGSVMSILKNLGLENSKFLIDFEKTNPSSEGKENIKFLFSANPDQKLAPLSQVISGGEMSRFLLAIKSCISKNSNTFFLDEIDNGLSGKSLFSLVELIKSISSYKQVLCITHQPFLAAAGDVHFKVSKDVVKGMTYTKVSKLATKKERQIVLSEMIGGASGDAIDYASTLLDRAAA